MRIFILPVLFFCLSWTGLSQELEQLEARIVNDATNFPLENVHIVNLQQIKGAITNEKGAFKIQAAVNDSLYISLLGFKSIHVKVTKDLIKYKNSTIKLTELAYALEEVIVKPHELTGVLPVDIKNAPSGSATRYQISGLPTAYEAGSYNKNGISKVLGALFNPVDALYSIFGKKQSQMNKLRQMRKEDAIRDLLAQKFDRKTLLQFLQIDKTELEEVLQQCNYSKGFIITANDLQILEAISQCYEEYKVLDKKIKR